MKAKNWAHFLSLEKTLVKRRLNSRDLYGKSSNITIQEQFNNSILIIQ